MKNRWVRYSAVTMALAVLLCVSISAAAQSKSEPVPNLYGGLGRVITFAELNKLAALPAPRTKDGHPDLTGYWGPPPGYAPSGDNYGSTEVSADGKTTVLGVLNPHQIDQGVGAQARAAGNNRATQGRA